MQEKHAINAMLQERLDKLKARSYVLHLKDQLIQQKLERAKEKNRNRANSKNSKE